MKSLIIFLCALFVSSPAVLASVDELAVLYFNRPPYYGTEKGKAVGLLVNLTRNIFMQAGITPVYIEIPPQRILNYLKDPERKLCSIGWFKTKEREAFAKFSRPIYQNKPLVILTTKANESLILKHPGIKDVFMDRSLVFARIDSFSYGSIMDEWINNYAPNVHEISTKQLTLPRLIVSGRASYMLAAPEEINTMLNQAKVDPALFVSISKSDIPKGNKRYIIFSRTIDDRTVERINAAIDRFSSEPLEDTN